MAAAEEVTLPMVASKDHRLEVPSGLVAVVTPALVVDGTRHMLTGTETGKRQGEKQESNLIYLSPFLSAPINNVQCGSLHSGGLSTLWCLIRARKKPNTQVFKQTLGILSKVKIGEGLAAAEETYLL